jgi:hypothetical protein
MQLERLESSTLLMPCTTVAPPVDVLVASPDRVTKVPEPPPTSAHVPLWQV